MHTVPLAEQKAVEAPPPQHAAPVPPQFALDARKLARQRFLFDEQIGFILGHELGHHYRGHTGCAQGGNATARAAASGRSACAREPLLKRMRAPLHICRMRHVAAI